MSASDAPRARHIWDTVDFSDIVATQGAFLEPRPPTPVWTTIAPDFVSELHAQLQIVQGAQEYRYRKYGAEAAEEWLMGYTPTELVQKHAAEVEAMLDAWDAPSPLSPSSTTDGSERVGLLSEKQTVRIHSIQRRHLATPAPSDTTSPRLRKRKRGQSSGATRTAADGFEEHGLGVGQAAERPPSDDDARRKRNGR